MSNTKLPQLFFCSPRTYSNCHYTSVLVQWWLWCNIVLLSSLKIKLKPSYRKVDQPLEKTCRRFLEACWVRWLGTVDNGSESPPFWILDVSLRVSCVPRAMEANENMKWSARGLVARPSLPAWPLKAPPTDQTCQDFNTKDGTENPLDKALFLKFNIIKTSPWKLHPAGLFGSRSKKLCRRLGGPNLAEARRSTPMNGGSAFICRKSSVEYLLLFF